MPGFDRTGPEGKGAMTGRHRGPCGEDAGSREDENSNKGFFGFRRGFGRGFGRGAGRGAGRGGGRGQGTGYRLGGWGWRRGA